VQPPPPCYSCSTRSRPRAADLGPLSLLKPSDLLPHTSDAGKGLGGGAAADARPHGRRRHVERSFVASSQALAAVSGGPPREAPPPRALGHGDQQSSRHHLRPCYTASPSVAWPHNLALVCQSAARPSGQRSGAHLGTSGYLEVAAPIQSRRTTQGRLEPVNQGGTVG
jgi:hypothetical protein